MNSRTGGRAALGGLFLNASTSRVRLLRVGIITATLLEALVFFVASAFHLRMPFYFGTRENALLPAAVVEIICCFLLAMAAYGSLMRKPQAWSLEMTAHFVSLFAVLIGTAALTIGREPATMANVIYHRFMLLALCAMLGVVWTAAARQVLGRPMKTVG